jgi:hypothetical protein
MVFQRRTNALPISLTLLEVNNCWFFFVFVCGAFISLIDVDIFARPQSELSICHFIYTLFFTSQLRHISCWYFNFEFH